MIKKQFHKFIQIVAFTLFFILANRRSISLWAIPLENNTLANVWRELVIWLILLGMFFWLTRKESRAPDYKKSWIKYLPLPIFIAIATLSVGWSVNVQVTIYKVIILIATSVIAAYVGVYMGLDRFLTILAWMGVVVAVLSLWLALAIPEEGTHLGHPYFGAWRGIFWSRARLGSFMALSNLVYLFQSARSIRQPKVLIVNLFFYITTMALVFLTRSATSIILVAVLHIAFFLALAWLKWQRQLKKTHYLVIGVLGLMLVFLVFTNLDILFGLLGRETNLTGRIPLWTHLLSEVFTQKPVFGYGFGAIWEHNSFRYQMQNVVGWPYPVIVADNGFLDILLNLGVFGLIAFLILFGVIVVRTFRYALLNKKIVTFFPIFLVSYIFITNLSLSYFFELEFFVWFLLITTMFIVTGESDG